MHAWMDNVVHVELTSADVEVGRLTARVLRERLPVEPGDVDEAPGVLEVRSSPERPVAAEHVARALQAAGVRVSRIYERPEWSVAEL